MTTEFIQVKKYLILGDMEAQGMSNFGNLTIEMFRFRLELCVLQWGILSTSSSLFYSYSHSLTMSLRYGWDEGSVLGGR